MSEDIQVRRLQLDHLPLMMAIEREAFNLAWSASMMRDSLQAAHCQSWGIFATEGELLGFGILAIVFDEAEILSMSISPRQQRKGYGEILLHLLLQKAKDSGATSILLEVRVSNIAAIKLYEKFGFHVTGVRHNYYPTEQAGLREDALLMRYDAMEETIS